MTRVLIVDDSLTVRMDLDETFREAGFDTLLCSSVGDAMAALETERVDVAILDVVLPDGDGTEILAHLRASPTMSAIPVVMLSSEAEVKDRVAGLVRGADEYIGKPYDAHTLVRRARDLVAPDGIMRARPVVLLVDDSVTYRGAVADHLDARGYDAVTADTGEEGLRKAAELRPDLVIVDGRLPGIDGATFIRRLRVDPGLLRVPVLYLTGSDDGADELGALDAGADLFARKDADLDAVAARVAALLRAAEESRRAQVDDTLSGGRRLLLIATSSGLIARVRATLARDGHDVVPAADKDEALKLLAIQLPDAVLIETDDDPAQTVAACRRVRELPLLARTPLIVLGASGQRADSSHAFDAGADDWLPLDVVDDQLLRARVRALLRRGAIEERARRVQEQLAARARALARANEELSVYREIIDRMPIGALVLEPDGGDPALRTVIVNPAFERLTGRARAALVGRPLDDVLAGISGTELRDRLATVLSGGDTQRVRGLRWEPNGADGPNRVLDTLAVRLVGRRLGVLIEDVTEREDALAARDRMEQQMHAAQRLEAVGQLAGGVAHDFNNILTVIKAFGGFLRDQFRPEDPLRDDVDTILAASDRAARLTTQLLAFSRRQVQHLSVMRLNEVITELERMLHRVIGENIALHTDLASDLWPIRADLTQMEQILMNLVVNARDAMPSGGQLTMVTHNATIARTATGDDGVPPGEYACVSVTDTGVGMDAATRSRLFEPFFTTKEKGKGTGLGLATVYGIVRQSGGYIAVDSALGEGTTFDVFLPRVEADAKPIARPHQATGRLELRGDETVLLVEDETMVRKATARILTRYGYTVLEASHAGDALLLAERHGGPIHAMITDIVMPEMSGPELVTRLAVVRPDMRVIFMSGYSDVALGDADASATFIQKPFSPDRLLKILRRVLAG